MIALFLAVINLSNVDPDAVKPAPVVLTKTADATGLLGLNQPLAGLGGDESSISVCTYGTPPLGPQLWNDAAGLSRTFTQPQCAGNPSGFDSTFGMPAFGMPAFGVSSFDGELGPIAMAMPLGSVRSQAPVTFFESPVRSSSVPSFPAVHLMGITQASGGFSFHEPAEYAGIHAVHGATRASTQSQPVPPARR